MRVISTIRCFVCFVCFWVKIQPDETSNRRLKGLSLTQKKNTETVPILFLARNSVSRYLKALDTIGNSQNNGWHKNRLGNEQWRAVDSIKHCEKQLPLK